MYKRILTKLERATKHYKTCRLKAKRFPRRGMYYCQGAFCSALFFFACMPFFLKQREEGYRAYIHSSSVGKMSFDEFLKRRRIAAIATLAFVGITGFTILRPIFEGNALPRKFVTVYESLTPNGWEVFFETDLFTTSTNNFLEDRNPNAAGHLAAWQQKTDKGWQVRAYDNEAQKTYLITNETGDHTEVRTDGRYVVWQAKNLGEWRIYYWDSENPETEYKELSDRRNSIRPRISEGIVVWQEWLDDNWEIVKREIGAPQKRRLTFNDTHDISPDILGHLIVWQAKGANGDSQIRVFHQRVEEEAGVLYDAEDQIKPRFDSRGYLHWFAYEEEGYVSAAYNYLSDDFIRRVIDPTRGRKKKGGDGGIILVDDSATSTESGIDESATSTEPEVTPPPKEDDEGTEEPKEEDVPTEEETPPEETPEEPPEEVEQPPEEDPEPTESEPEPDPEPVPEETPAEPEPPIEEPVVEEDPPTDPEPEPPSTESSSTEESI